MRAEKYKRTWQVKAEKKAVIAEAGNDRDRRGEVVRRPAGDFEESAQ